MKVCSKCKTEKSVNLFYKDNTRKDRLNNSCKECINFAQKKYRKLNTEKIHAKKKLYRKLNTEKIALKSKQYYIDNRERLAAYACVWNKNNPKKNLSYKRNWMKKNPVAVADYNKRITERLGDGYIKTHHLKINNPPKELIELKRVQILITRELRNKKQCQI